ncbi:ATP-binding cassette domain-containing protein [Listeria sp. FSL L7-1582]|uniref:ATP-binding cassette domain-containing protein n=1 Tax=Listeria portnoyi TaxID=2713504 RepID=UPI00164EB715|nr:ABC transporter ATP-binding protein [Listeria portnoyi]MBC6309827.1 ATP-binding cassette domain-containing protein [Listeria portnoyi]
MIKLSDVSKKFGKKEVINHLSVEINDGEKIFITGKNGSGKTTLLNLILGFEKSSQGEILLDYLPQDVQIIFQNQQRDQYFSIKEDLYLETILHGTNDFQVFMPFLNVDDMSKRLMKLSGGEWQKLQVIKAISSQPKLLITDEITTGLDYESRNLVYELLQEYFSENEVTYISVSHYIEEINKFADKVLYLKDGKSILYDNTNRDFTYEEEIQ